MARNAFGAVAGLSDHVERDTTRDRSSKQELSLATELRGEVQPNSGATPFRSKKGDVVCDDVLVEAKTTRRDSYSLTTSTLTKHTMEARSMGKTPLFVVELERLNETRIPSSWAIMPLTEYKRLREVDHEERS